MSLNELYQEILLDHNRSPRNFKEIKGIKKEAFNPLCGDHFTIFAKIKNKTIEDISFIGSGCAISKASASIMSDFVKGKDIKEARKIIHSFEELVKSGSSDIDLDELEVFSGVHKYPLRVKCATLSWHALKNILKESGT
jgi:nitrogen fixation NifU-like protein